MILSSNDIQAWMKAGDIGIDPFDASNLKAGSYTLTLDSRFYVLKKVPFIDSRNDVPEREFFTLSEEGYLLQPGEFIVGFSRERVRLSEKVFCLLGTRGSRAQMGLDAIQSSLFAEPGSDNQMALEISNSGSIPVKLFVGIKIVKAIFIPMSDAFAKSRLV